MVYETQGGGRPRRSAPVANAMLGRSDGDGRWRCRWRSDARGRWRHGVARRGSVSVVISSFLRLSSFFEPTGGQWATEVHRALEGDVATQHTLPRAVSTAHASAPSLSRCLSLPWGVGRPVSIAVHLSLEASRRSARVDVRRRVTVLSVFLL